MREVPGSIPGQALFVFFLRSSTRSHSYNPLDTAKQSSKAPKKDKSGDKSKPQPESFSGNCATVKCNVNISKYHLLIDMC